jgi:hypothetical protein
MSQQEMIFRREALDSWARGQKRAGGVVRLGGPWLSWLFWLTLVLLAAAALSLWAIRTEERTSGPAVVDPGTGSVTVLLPAASAVDLPSSRGLTVELPLTSSRSVPVQVMDVQPADDRAVRRAGLRPLSQPGILLTGRLQSPPDLGAALQDGPVQTRGTVVLRSERLVDLLARQFSRMLGETGAGR